MSCLGQDNPKIIYIITGSQFMPFGWSDRLRCFCFRASVPKTGTFAMSEFKGRGFRFIHVLFFCLQDLYVIYLTAWNNHDLWINIIAFHNLKCISCCLIFLSIGSTYMFICNKKYVKKLKYRPSHVNQKCNRQIK